MQLDGRGLHWPLAAKQLVSRLEGEDPDHLGCAKETMRLLGVACACERTGSHAVAEPNVRSEERRVGEEGVSTCRYRWWQDILKEQEPADSCNTEQNQYTNKYMYT